MESLFPALPEDISAVSDDELKTLVADHESAKDLIANEDEEFLRWADENPKSITRADDGVAGRWARDTDQDIRVCVPSLVEHPDMEPSVKGGQKARWGKDSMRKAVVWAEDGLAHSW